MKKYICTLLTIVALAFVGCDDILDRPQLDKPIDSNFWRNETDIRLFANDFYPNYFVGYNSGWGVAYTPLRGYNFSDDVAYAGKQSSFENSIPSSRGSSSADVAMLTDYAGPNWNFVWVRKVNLFLNRLETKAKSNVSEEVFTHWYGVGEFIKGYEYCRLVSVFGAVPYFEKEFTEMEKDIMFKDRDSREVVMEQVYTLFKNSLSKIRLDDGVNVLNRYIAAGFISRFMLFEGTWQKYHGGNKDLAKKYLAFAVEAAEFVMNSNKYGVSGDFRSLFGTQDLKGHKEMLMYRHYDATKNVVHHIASYSNAYETQDAGSNLALAKAFICNDGKTYQKSSAEGADVLNMTNMLKTRDPRFEATFWNGSKEKSATLLYACKFIDRVGPTYWNSGAIPAMYGSSTNTNDGPVIRYSEVLMNWIEAKAELALSYSGAAVTQVDIDKSINALRDRPLDSEAIAKGVKKTPHLNLVDVTADFDPDRDKGNVVAGDYEVNSLIWEIRRERRMEFVFEHSRLLDLKRWMKLHYMDNTKYPDTMLGLWIDLKKEIPSFLDPNAKGEYVKRQVSKMDGTVVTYDGTNADAMIGYYVPLAATLRDGFTNRSYCAPVGKAQIEQYKDVDEKYNLSQTEGW